MRGEIADQDVRQRLVIVGILVLAVRALTPGFTVRAGSAVLIAGVTALAFAAHGHAFPVPACSSSALTKPRSMRTVPSWLRMTKAPQRAMSAGS